MSEWTQERLDALLVEWQKVLRLQDWNASVSLVRRQVMGSYCLGNCWYTQSKKTARIRLLDPIDLHPEEYVNSDLEQTLVHELLHLHFAPFFPLEADEDDPQRIAQEQAIELTAKALVSLKRRAFHDDSN